MKSKIATIMLFVAVSVMLIGCTQRATAVETLGVTNEADDGLDMSNPFDVMEYMREHAQQNSEQEEVEPTSKALADGVILCSQCGYDEKSQKKALLILNKDSDIAKQEEVEFCIVEDDTDKELFTHKASIETYGANAYAILDFTKYEGVCKAKLVLKDDPTIKEPLQIKRGLYAELFEKELYNLIHSDVDYEARDFSEQIEIVTDLTLICEYADNDIYRDEIQGMLQSYLDILSKEVKTSGKLSADEKNAAIASIINGASFMSDNLKEQYIDAMLEIVGEIKEDSDSGWEYCKAASVWKITDKSEYKNAFEKMAKTKTYRGFDYSSPGYIGSLVYVSCKKPDYSIAEELVNSIINDANEYVNEGLFEKVMSNEEIEFRELNLLPVVNEISRSTQYTKYMQNTVAYMCGCNPDYKEYIDEDEYGMLFILAYLCK